ANFPTVNPFQVNNGGGINNHDDAFVVKIGNIGPTPTPTPTPIPTPTPAVDTITIQRAEYQLSRRVLRVDAAGTEPTADLRVYVTATDALIGTMKSNGNGRFSAQLSWPTNP